jgi:hypothetical protein
MHKWRIGPCLAMLLLVTIATWGVASSPPNAVPQPSATTDHHQKPKGAEDNQPPLFFIIGAWIHDNREIIDPVAAVGAFVAAGVLAVVTFMLFGATDKLAATTGDLANAAHQQVAEMVLARDLMTKRLDLQERQFLLTDKQTNLAINQHGLQREQYLAEHRPRIRIRSIGIAREAGELFHPQRTIKGSLVIVNVGASDAMIRRAEYRFYWDRNSLPMVPPLDLGQVKYLFSATLPYRITGHESCSIAIESNGPPAGEDADRIRQGGPVFLYVMGAVLFSDADLKERWMGFCQKYTVPEKIGGEGRFIPVENPNYEYED